MIHGATQTSTAVAPATRHNVGGDRLAEAFATVSGLPALADARRRVIELAAAPESSTVELASAVETDPGLTIAIVRAVNGGGTRRASGVSGAAEELGPRQIATIATGLEVYDPIGSAIAWRRQERFRRHAVATRQAAALIADAAGLAGRDELALAALLHDVGKLVIAELHGDREAPDSERESPEERVSRERRELGVDHALMGAVLVRRWGVARPIASAIERHHAPDAEGHAAAVRLADLIAHYAAGDAVSVEALHAVAGRLGLGGERLRALLYEFPHAAVKQARASDPCPLSAREMDVLRGLADGKVYKQIAQERALSVSTVRTHLHNVYRKIGAVDRAQAVLIAHARGWL